MQTNVQYVIDEKGKKNSVIIPFRHWETINQKYSAMENKLRILLGLKDAIGEVKSSRKNGKQLKTLDEFLNEHNR